MTTALAAFTLGAASALALVAGCALPLLRAAAKDEEQRRALVAAQRTIAERGGR